LLTNSSDLQTLPTHIHDMNNSNLPYQQIFISPTILSQYQIAPSPNDNSRVLSINTLTCSTNISPVHCASFAMKQQVKLAGSNMFRYYSSII
jgi:hypothetical protein